MTNSTVAVVAIAECYLRGLRDKDLRAVPFAPGVTLESPLTPRLTGSVAGYFDGPKEVVIDPESRVVFLASVGPADAFILATDGSGNSATAGCAVGRNQPVR